MTPTSGRRWRGNWLDGWGEGVRPTDHELALRQIHSASGQSSPKDQAVPIMSFESGGAGGIRTLGTSLSSYAGLANQCLQPLGHSSTRQMRSGSRDSGQPLFAVSAGLWKPERSLLPARPEITKTGGCPRGARPPFPVPGQSLTSDDAHAARSAGYRSPGSPPSRPPGSARDRRRRRCPWPGRHCGRRG